jgi:hypothetical protein
MYYIYNNSQATAKQGFWADKKWYIGSKRRTTLEFAFAKKFETLEEAKSWVSTYNRIGIIFERKDE